MRTLQDRLLEREQSIQDIGTVEGKRSARDNRPGQPTEYIGHLKRIMRQAASRGIQQILVVIYCRVSSDKQRRYGNLDHQLAEVRRRVHRLGKRYGIEVEILDEFGEDVSAWRLWKSERPELEKAAKLARKKNAVLVALNTSRFVRNKDYQRHGTLPTVDDFEQLMGIVGKVRLATILPPDQHEDRGIDTIRGKHAKDKSPGYKKRRRASLRSEFIPLMRQGKNPREICRLLGLPLSQESNLRRWRKKYLD